MIKSLKTVVWTLIVAFALFYLYTRPEAAAEFVKGLFGFVDSVGRFFTSLAQ
ncbi:MAG TPA: hypothetical protein VLR88_01450 [Propionibacteriaceae bacterium]|nr:hypothetical protein [Propionibacteriaceae bacterium]